eukprot:COSAG01_NODE_67989_length_265_cov_0.927711_1_plen_20_part_01
MWKMALFFFSGKHTELNSVF